MKYIITFILTIIIFIRPTAAQPVIVIDSADYDALIKRLEKLEQEVSRQKEEDDLEELLNQATQLAVQEREEEADISKKFYTGIRQQQGLNPNISVCGDFFGAVSTSKSNIITDPSRFNFGNNGMHLREIELSFISTLDPFARGKLFLSLQEANISVEEAYMELLNLPIKASVRAGKLFAEYGLLNRYHTHALPQFDRPRVATNYFGVDNFGGIGLAGYFMLPSLLFADASSLDIAVVEGGNEFSFTDKRKMNFFYFVHFKNFYDLSESSYIEYTLSGMTGILTVFALLIIPVSISTMATESWRNKLLIGWSLGIVVAILGLFASWKMDVPASPVIIVLLALGLLVMFVVRKTFVMQKT